MASFFRGIPRLYQGNDDTCKDSCGFFPVRFSVGDRYEIIDGKLNCNLNHVLDSTEIRTIKHRPSLCLSLLYSSQIVDIIIIHHHHDHHFFICFISFISLVSAGLVYNQPSSLIDLLTRKKTNKQTNKHTT